MYFGLSERRESVGLFARWANNRDGLDRTGPPCFGRLVVSLTGFLFKIFYMDLAYLDGGLVSPSYKSSQY